MVKDAVDKWSVKGKIRHDGSYVAPMGRVDVRIEVLRGRGSDCECSFRLIFGSVQSDVDCSPGHDWLMGRLEEDRKRVRRMLGRGINRPGGPSTALSTRVFILYNMTSWTVDRRLISGVFR